MDLARIRTQAEERLPVTGKDVIALLDLIEQLQAQNEQLTREFRQTRAEDMAEIQGGIEDEFHS